MLEGIPMYTSKTDMVSALLREMILSGELKGSQALRQRDIALQFDVSQTPVREALRRLESEGLVINDPHRGATVAESHAGGLEENYQIRAALESLGAGLAARSITDRQLAHLSALNDKMRAVGETDEAYAPLNREFHFYVYECADSPLLLSLMRLLWQSMPGGPRVLRSHGESTRQHDALLAALHARDGDAAAEATREHILGSPHLSSTAPGLDAIASTPA
jgi:DNA-binding GntR family transcriptional regulator